MRGRMMAAPEAGGRRGWSARSVGAGWQHRFFYRLIRCGGRGAAYGFLRIVAVWYTLCRPGERRKTRPYLDRRFPGRGGTGRLLDSYRMIVSLGEALIDRAVVGILGPARLAVELQGREELLRLLTEGRGLLIVQAHVGGWQVAMSALGCLDRPVQMLMRREDGDVDRHWHEHAGLPRPYGIIDPGGYLGGTLEMLAALKRGEVVCVMGDRVFGSGRNTLPVDFLGGRAPFPYSPYKVAAAAGCPVAVLFSAKTGPKSYRLELAAVIRVAGGTGRPAEAYRDDVEQFVRALERYTREHPWQFFNFYDMWNCTRPAPDRLS